MKKQLLLTCLITLSTLFSVAQKDTAYIYTFGGENDEQGRDIELTSDSGFIMVGSTSSFGAGNSDIYLVKVDSNINYEWSAAIGHEFTEFGHAVKQTADNGYIICGYTNSIGNGRYDAYLVRTDDKGKLLWEKTFGGFEWDFAYDLEITADGGFLIVGETHSLGNGNADAYLIKTDKDGNLLWEKTMGGTGKDIAHALIATKDGNFAFCGENASKNPANKGDAWLVKFDGNGDTLWDRTILSTEYTTINDLIENDSKYFSVGSSYEINKTILDIYTISFNDKGEFLWDYYHGGVNQGTLNKKDEGFSIDINSKGSLIIVGSSASSGNGGSGLYFSEIYQSNGFYKAGPTFGDNRDEMGYSNISLPEKNIAFGNTYSYGVGYNDMYLIVIPNDTIAQEYNLKISSDTSKLTDVINTISDELDFQSADQYFFPNPSRDEVNFDPDEIDILHITNILGETVKPELKDNTVTFYRPGSYFISFLRKDIIETSCVIIQ